MNIYKMIMPCSFFVSVTFLYFDIYDDCVVMTVSGLTSGY